MYALRQAGPDVGPGGLCKLLDALAARGGKPVSGERVCVVFDGPARRGLTAERVELAFSAPVTADEVILRRISDNSAPRRLTVVSTDREIRRAARRRRCKISTSEDFARAMLRALDRPEKGPSPEPLAKRTGRLSQEETRAWMREFGIEEGVDDPTQV